MKIVNINYYRGTQLNTIHHMVCGYGTWLLLEKHLFEEISKYQYVNIVEWHMEDNTVRFTAYCGGEKDE